VDETSDHEEHLNDSKIRRSSRISTKKALESRETSSSESESETESDSEDAKGGTKALTLQWL